MSAPRFLLYSHDSYGLGHFRRNLTIAQAIVRDVPGASVLLVTGNPCCSLFDEAPGIDIVKLPSIGKDEAGDYQPRSLVGSLRDVLRMRSRILLEAYRAFAPDLVLVDHRVDGLHGEAVLMLKEAKLDGARRVLGLRDVIDSPDRVADEWRTTAPSALSLYDAVLVYGMREVLDPVADHPGFERVRDRARYVGYVVRDIATELPRVESLVPEVLLTVGGGEDGLQRVERYLDALRSREVPWRSTVVLGPMFDARESRRLRREHSRADVDFRRFHADLPRLMQQAAVVVGMAGYNTCAEVVACGRPAVLWPRTHPREEQLLRARRMSELGWTRHVVDPRPDHLLDTIQESLERPLEPSVEPDLAGATNAVRVLEELLGREVARTATFPGLNRRRAIS